MRRSGARWCCECQKGCCLLEPDPRVMAARTLMAQQLVRAFGMQWSDVRAFYVRSLPTRKVGGWATTAAATKAGQAANGPGAAARGCVCFGRDVHGAVRLFGDEG